MRRAIAVVAVLASLFSAPGAQLASVTSYFVTTPERAYFLAPARLVSGAIVHSLEFSPDGRYAIVEGQDRPDLSGRGWLGLLLGAGQAEPRPWTQVWDTQADRLRPLSPEIAELLSLRDWSGQDAWSRSRPGTLVVMSPTGNEGPDRMTWRIVRIDLASGQAATIATIQPNGRTIPRILPSPTKPVVAVTWGIPITSADPTIVRTDVHFAVYSLDGRQLNRGNQIVDGRASLFGWSKDGSTVVGMLTRRQARASPAQLDTLALNPSTGVLTATDEELEIGEQGDESPLTLSVERLNIKRGNATHVAMATWLVSSEASDHPQTLVSSDTQEAWLSPALDRVAFIQEGRLFSRDIVSVDRAQFEQAMAMAERQKAMNEAKQVATAMMIYAADYDDLLPQGANWQDRVHPYVKDKSLFDGFVYLLDGQDGTKIDSPSTTELGYKRVKGGRVVAYADSSVRFVPDP